MRRGRFFTLAGVVAAVFSLTAAGTALAADSQAIYNDVADGQLTQSYSQADLQAATKDATVEGYGGVTEQTSKPVVQAAAGQTKTYVCVGLDRNGNKIMAPANASNTGANAHSCTEQRYVCTGMDSNGKPTYGVASASNTTSSGAPKYSCVKGTQFTQTKAAGTLPFTGSQLGVFAALGLALLAGGVLLRRAARD
jgi:hypothetical protein